MTTRRGFFKLVAGAALMPLAAKAAALLPSVPVLWGDGVHDDTEALQAFLDGKVVEFSNAEAAQGAGWFGDMMVMPRGRYRITTHPIFRDPNGGTMRGKTFQGSGSSLVRVGEHRWCFEIQNAENCAITNWHSVGEESTGGVAWIL